MTERDRVLDAFRNCITEPKCKNCPWTECETIGHGTIEIPRDLALAVMRELVVQEPRVLTLGEVMALEEGTGDVWIEDAPMPYTSHWIEAVTLVGKTDWQETDEVTFSNEITYHPTSYRLNTAQGWRCWTGRPNEEQVNMKTWVEVIGGNEDDA